MAIELRKGSAIILEKKSNVSLGEIVVNLNWNQGGDGKKKSFFASLLKHEKGIDLDLGALYELTNGQKGSVQALGNVFGNYRATPYISLDSDDRTGESTEGENLRINGAMVARIKRILVYTFIYEGVASWQQVDGIVTIQYPDNEDIIVRMDEYGSAKKLCGIVLLANQHNETFSIEKVVQFYDDQLSLDRAFGWGMDWSIGRKD
ncbi:MAG: TerD family protein [Spirochaetaceae bacterium]|jgi:tellurite resistance protein TerA|nr:TerD family protein [Spirochaetaceae bacterium]